MSAKDIDYVLKAVNDPKGNINKSLAKINGLEKQIKLIKKDPKGIKKKALRDKINTTRKNMVDSLVKRLNKGGSKVKPEDIWRLMQNKEMSKWNPVRIKDFWMNKAPEATKKWLSKSKAAKVGTGLLRFRTGAAIKDALGVDINFTTFVLSIL